MDTEKGNGVAGKGSGTWEDNSEVKVDTKTAKKLNPSKDTYQSIRIEDGKEALWTCSHVTAAVLWRLRVNSS